MAILFLADEPLLQIFSVKVVELMGGLQWPIDVYGVVAVRDSLDHKRNILFFRERDDCQTLLQDSSSLVLTGPSRAVVLLDPVVFEVDLKVKGRGAAASSQDKILSHHAFVYAYLSDNCFARREVESTEHSTMEFTFVHLTYAVEATIIIHVVQGSTNIKARFSARTAGIDEDVVLLDSGDRKVVVAEDGLVVLQRHVVVVEEKGRLSIHVEASEDGSDEVVGKQVSISARPAWRSEGRFMLGFCTMSVIVAWSVLP